MKEEGFACDLEPEFALIWASHQALLAATLLLLVSWGQQGTRQRVGELGLNPLTFLISLAWGCFTCCGTNLFFFFHFNHLSFESQDLIFSCSVPRGGGSEAASKHVLLLLTGAGWGTACAGPSSHHAHRSLPRGAGRRQTHRLARAVVYCQGSWSQYLITRK